MRLPALLIAAMIATAPALAAEDEPCRGAHDNTERAGTDIVVAAPKRETFLADVRAYGRMSALTVSSATDQRGWIVLLLETRPPGVVIEIESTGEHTFHAAVRTCNAQEDWRPPWTAFKAYIDANSAAWRP